MQITDVKHFLANPGRGKNLCFVKVETDEGIYGWGEAYTQSDRDVQVTAHIDQMRRYLIGRDPRNIKHFLQWSYDDFRWTSWSDGLLVRRQRYRARAVGHHRQGSRECRCTCSSAARAGTRSGSTPTAGVVEAEVLSSLLSERRKSSKWASTP